ncbi:MAG: hypothetical protein IJE90_04905 [Clostridia bacterium]|nr:hypothetical protein [Clostridia bacterium]
MERIRSLNWYQKTLIIITILTVLIFSIIYPRVVNRVGIRYNDQIFVPETLDGATVYSGELDGIESKFIVSADNTVEFYYGDKLFGPYTLINDPSAVPQNHTNASRMTGIELRCGDEVVFRGGIAKFGSDYWCLYDEKGDSNSSFTPEYTIGNTGYKSKKGSAEPNTYTILSLMRGPELTHKGDKGFLLIAVFVSIVNLITILFADELFKFGLRLRISNAEDAEPSEWELMGRYGGWTFAVIMIISILIYGLQ